MKELTITRRGDAPYIDSREVAEIIGKRHGNLLRDIDGYMRTLEKAAQLNFELCEFFVPDNYIDPNGRARPCYMISRRGADIIAGRTAGEKGVLFTAAYVRQFHEAAEREREREIAEIEARAATPRMQTFNAAVRNVLAGFNEARAEPGEVMGFLRGAYRPFGIKVAERGERRYDWWHTATDLAWEHGMRSLSGRPHGHAAAAVAAKLEIWPEHVIAVPYGLTGVTLRYDPHVVEKVGEWLTANGHPADIPHNGFEYHVRYDRRRTPPHFGHGY
jgi:Rha family phage regulatory protein